jgi:hypothetical protein
VKPVALLLSLALLTNGCSLLFVRPPRPGGGAGPGGCTTNKVAPVLDSAFAGWQAVRIVIAGTASEDAYRGAALSREADLLLGVILGVVGASSAIYGFRTVDECRSSGEYVNPYAPRRTTTIRNKQQQKAEEAAEEAAVQARLRARAAEAAAAAEADEAEDAEAPSVTPVPTSRPDAGM